MENYKDKQKKYKDLNKQRGSWFWVSKLGDRVVNGKVEKNPLNKGRTYVKPKTENGE